MTIKGYKQAVKPSPAVIELETLLSAWRETPVSLQRVRSDLVVPDTSNRSHTMLSLDHVHFIASSILKDGFKDHRPPAGSSVSSAGHQGHDIPVLVRSAPLGVPQGPPSDIATESLLFWKGVTERENSFPGVTISPRAESPGRGSAVPDGSAGSDGSPAAAAAAAAAAAPCWFTSLGNGHFTQALNLFRHRTESVFTNEPFTPPPDDASLARALDEGVPSIILRSDMGIVERRRLAVLLNDVHYFKWTVDHDGAVDISPESCAMARPSLFESQSKVLNSEELSALVRLELGIGLDSRATQGEMDGLSRMTAFDDGEFEPGFRPPGGNNGDRRKPRLGTTRTQPARPKL